MAIEFDGTNAYINFGEIVDNQDVKSISFWIYPDVVNKAQNFIYKTGGGWIIYASLDDIAFTQGWSVTNAFGIVYDVISINNWYHIGVTYDGSIASNLPNIYVNGEIVALDSSTPADGTINDDSDGELFVGGIAADSSTRVNGKIKDARIYNRILSAAEIAEIYNSRCQRTVSRGLIFAPVFDGAAGLSKFDGATLGTANTITDWVSGAIGIPYGNPIGRGNTEQRIY